MKNESKRATFLLCEADPEIRTVIRQAILQAHSNSLIIEATDGVEATLKAGKQHFDVVISDLNLPKKNGYQLVKFINSNPPELQPRAVIMLTEANTEESFMDFQRAVGFIAKPVTTEAILKHLTRIFAEETGGKAAASGPNIEFINPFVDGAVNVLSTTAQTPLTKEGVFVRKQDQISGDISAVIAMNSLEVQGSMAIAFDEQTFLKIVSRMLGEEFKTISPDITDAAGEICNQIFGFAKRKLNEIGFSIQPAIPSVITGTNHKIKHLIQAPVIAVKFNSDVGPVIIEACVARKRK